MWSDLPHCSAVVHSRKRRSYRDMSGVVPCFCERGSASHFAQSRLSGPAGLMTDTIVAAVSGMPASTISSNRFTPES